MLLYLQMAAGVALPTDSSDCRNFYLGCVGIREDGVLVASRNGATDFSSVVPSYQLPPTSHAEGRCLRKAGKYSTMYVARVLRKDGALAMARPCAMCRTRLAAAKVKKVFYTIDDNHYGIWFPRKDHDRICEA